MSSSQSSQASPSSLKSINITPINISNYRSHQYPSTSSSSNNNLCLLPSPSGASRPVPLITPASSQPPPPSKPSTVRKRKEEAPVATYNSSTDHLCYQCGDFFTDDQAFKDHKSYHSFAKVVTRFYIDEKRGLSTFPEFENPFEPAEEKEYTQLRLEQMSKKKDVPENHHLHQNHHFAINSTMLDKKPAVKVYDTLSGDRVTSSAFTSLEPPVKQKRIMYSGDPFNPIGPDVTNASKQHVQELKEQRNEARKKQVTTKLVNIITLDD